MKINIDGLADALKILEDVVKNTIDVGDYRITVIVEKKINEKSGVIIEDMVVEKRLSKSQIGEAFKRIKDVINDM